jgi:hypothetical protein
MALEKELETYRRELPNLLKQRGKFALVHGETVDSIWDTEEEAVEAGDDRFGLEPFLVMQIRETETPRYVPGDLIPKCPT